MHKYLIALALIATPAHGDSIERRIERAREWLADYTKGME